MSEIQDEAYTEACEEIVDLKRLVRRTIAALECYPILSQPGAVLSDLLAELRKAAK